MFFIQINKKDNADCILGKKNVFATGNTRKIQDLFDFVIPKDILSLLFYLLSGT
jgi:hypothetical protein